MMDDIHRQVYKVHLPGRKNDYPPPLSAGTRPARTQGKNAAEKNKSHIYQSIKHDPALLVKPISGEPKYTTVARQVVLRAMRETSVLFSTNAVGLVEVARHENMAKSHACTTAKGIMGVYPGCSF